MTIVEPTMEAHSFHFVSTKQGYIQHSQVLRRYNKAANCARIREFAYRGSDDRARLSLPDFALEA